MHSHIQNFYGGGGGGGGVNKSPVQKSSSWYWNISFWSENNFFQSEGKDAPIGLIYMQHKFWHIFFLALSALGDRLTLQPLYWLGALLVYSATTVLARGPAGIVQPLYWLGALLV